jgi:hypothetical protein
LRYAISKWVGKKADQSVPGLLGLFEYIRIRLWPHPLPTNPVTDLDELVKSLNEESLKKEEQNKQITLLANDEKQCYCDGTPTRLYSVSHKAGLRSRAKAVVTAMVYARLLDRSQPIWVHTTHTKLRETVRQTIQAMRLQGEQFAPPFNHWMRYPLADLELAAWIRETYPSLLSINPSKKSKKQTLPANRTTSGLRLLDYDITWQKNPKSKNTGYAVIHVPRIGRGNDEGNDELPFIPPNQCATVMITLITLAQKK